MYQSSCKSVHSGRQLSQHSHKLSYGNSTSRRHTRPLRLSNPEDPQIKELSDEIKKLVDQHTKKRWRGYLDKCSFHQKSNNLWTSITNGKVKAHTIATSTLTSMVIHVRTTKHVQENSTNNLLLILALRIT